MSGKRFYIRGLALLGALCCCLAADAQHRVLSYVELGSPVPGCRVTYGLAVQADLRVASWVRVRGGIRLANAYPSGLGDVQAGATLFFRKDSQRWSCDHLLNFSNYAPYPMNQLYYRLLFTWQSKHVRIDAGNAFAFFIGSGVTKYHLFRPSFSVRGSVREAGSPWNVSFFIRNFNRFEAHGSRCMEWGGEVSAFVARRWMLFCEPYVVTAGNFNGTATFYHFNVLLGGAYRW